MKYKAGESVVIREWEAMVREREFLKYNGIKPKNGKFFVNLHMREYCGCRTVIKEVYDNYYTLNIDNGNNVWTDEMIAHNFHYGDKVLVNNNKAIKPIELIFLSFTDGIDYPYRVTNEYNYSQDIIECSTSWKYCTKILNQEPEPKHTVTLSAGTQVVLTREDIEKIKGMGS